MEKKESIAEQIKTWIFPSILSLLSLLIWSMVTDIKSDISDVKSDIKALMAQSNIDKTRIDNLERAIYKSNTVSFPSIPPVQEPELTKRVAILPKEDDLYAKK
jgi:hypothetical protein